MSASMHQRRSDVGFLGLIEGPLLGFYLGWSLQAHGMPAVVFAGSGIALTCAYFMMVNAGGGSAMNAPVTLISMTIWAFVGWNLGGFCYHAFVASMGNGAMLHSVIAWKFCPAAVFAFIAFADKTSFGAAH